METKKNWTPIPGPYPRRLCLEVYNEAAGTCYEYQPKSEQDAACESIIYEMRGLLKAQTAEEALAFFNTEDADFDIPAETWKNDWKTLDPTTPFNMIKKVRKIWRERAGLEAV